jgi:hypothetical protein
MSYVIFRGQDKLTSRSLRAIEVQDHIDCLLDLDNATRFIAMADRPYINCHDLKGSIKQLVTI